MFKITLTAHICHLKVGFVGTLLEKRKTLTIAVDRSNASQDAQDQASKTASKAVEEVQKTVLSCLDEAKAEEIVTIDIADKSALGDTMVVASGRSQRHVSAIADQLLRALKAIGCKSLKTEGMPNCDWVLVDTGDVIVHIFRPEVREFYALEKMWQMPDVSQSDIN